MINHNKMSYGEAYKTVIDYGEAHDVYNFRGTLNQMKKSWTRLDTYEKDAYNVIMSSKFDQVIITEDDGYLD